jgi:endonuclease-8
MPEGDTVSKLAAALAPELRGQALRAVYLKRLDGRHLSGRTVSSVVSRGKHLLIHLEGGVVLRSHLGLYGSWHSYGSTEAWRKPRRQASIILTTDARLYVCFNAREVEILGEQGFRLADRMHRLGPDLAGAALDLEEIQRRVRELLEPETPLVDLLLDQRVAAGVGNVYKSEVLFLERRHPLDRLCTLSAGDVGSLYRCARGLIRRNLGGGPRVTRFVADGAGGLWVYRRAGLPCLRCGRPVRRRLLGTGLRSTYWCPGCQARRAVGNGRPPTP